jgi:hypothetical protein
MEDNIPSEERRPANLRASDTLIAYLLAALIFVWLLAYAYFAARAWIGRP